MAVRPSLLVARGARASHGIPKLPPAARPICRHRGRETTATLTISAPDAQGHQAWSLSDGATINDVTHLRCRAAVYTAKTGEACTPDKTPTQVFPMDPGREMPAIEGCTKQDYQVLIVIGRMVDS